MAKFVGKWKISNPECYANISAITGEPTPPKTSSVVKDVKFDGKETEITLLIDNTQVSVCRFEFGKEFQDDHQRKGIAKLEGDNKIVFQTLNGNIFTDIITVDGNTLIENMTDEAGHNAVATFQKL